MPDRVFLSSTFTDLVTHREAVQKAIRQLGAIDVSMEHFGARDERPADECARLVRDESDIFVGIYAHRYGYVPEGGELSVCEMEYRAASDVPLPRFLYLVDPNHPWPPAHVDDGVSRARLSDFKTQLRKRHICQTFTTEDSLAARVVADVGRHVALKGAPKVGAMTVDPKVGPGVPVPNIGLESIRGPVVETSDDWNRRRRASYDEKRGLFLTHVCRPSTKPGQLFDVFIYLLRHKSSDLSDVRVAEFFLGPYWENKVFPAVEQNGFIGIATSAYGTFLCLCRVTFVNGTQIHLERYIDFEAQRTGGPGV